MNGVDLDSGKKPLRQRSPFIDVPMINCSDKARTVMIMMVMMSMMIVRMINCVDKARMVMMVTMMILTMMMINCMDKDEADKFFDDMEARPSPRMIKTHYPFEFLPPNLLETCKVTKDFKVTM